MSADLAGEIATPLPDIDRYACGALPVRVTSLDGKWKPSQNRPEPDIARVIAGLDAQGPGVTGLDLAVVGALAWRGVLMTAVSLSDLVGLAGAVAMATLSIDGLKVAVFRRLGVRSATASSSSLWRRSGTAGRA